MWRQSLGEKEPFETILKELAVCFPPTAWFVDLIIVDHKLLSIMFYKLNDCFFVKNNVENANK